MAGLHRARGQRVRLTLGAPLHELEAVASELGGDVEELLYLVRHRGGRVWSLDEKGGFATALIEDGENEDSKLNGGIKKIKIEAD